MLFSCPIMILGHTLVPQARITVVLYSYFSLVLGEQSGVYQEQNVNVDEIEAMPGK
jgi:hypothetical protein